MLVPHADVQATRATNRPYPKPGHPRWYSRAGTGRVQWKGAGMETGRVERLTSLAGVLFAVLFTIGMVVSYLDTPDSDASGAAVIDHYGDEAKVFAGILMLVLGGLMFMFFAGALRNRLRTGPEWLAAVAFGGAVIYATALGIFAMSQIALVEAAKVGQPEVAQALNIIDNNNFFPAVIGMTVLLFATAWNVLASRSFPAWVGWLALALGILSLAGPAGFVAFLLFPVWVLTVAIELFRSPEPGAPRAEPVDA